MKKIFIISLGLFLIGCKGSQERSIVINAPVDEVWAVFSDLGGLAGPLPVKSTFHETSVDLESPTKVCVSLHCEAGQVASINFVSILFIGSTAVTSDVAEFLPWDTYHIDPLATSPSGKSEALSNAVKCSCPHKSLKTAQTSSIGALITILFSWVPLHPIRNRPRLIINIFFIFYSFI